MLPPVTLRSSPLRRFALSGAALFVVLVVLLSCMGEPTAPKKSNVMYATGLRFNTVFPAAFQQSAFAGVVTFDRVRIVLRRRDLSVALDTIINFPANVDSIRLELNVPLSPGASATGEDLMVSLGYLNTANDTVFKGTKQITATPTLPGQAAQAPVTIPVVYTGPGFNATAVRITPRQLSVNGGGTFAFTAVGVDAAGVTVPNTPISWSSLDAARASIISPAAGSGVALNQRGAARIVATLITSQADTATVNVILPPTAIAAVSGSGQVGVIGKTTARPFAQPLVVKVSAADGVGVSGVAVNFAAATGGGSVSPASAVTDANGLGQTTWTPGNTVGAQTATAAAAGLTGSPVTFTATANQTVATKLVFTSAPAAGTSVNALAPITFSVAAQDVDGDPVSSFAGTVTLAIGAGPAGSTLAGVTSVAAVGGVASFPNVSIAAPGTGYVISAASTGLTGASTLAFNIVNGAATSITLVSGGGQTAAPGALLAPITVLLKDAAGNPTAATAVSFDIASGAGTVTPGSAHTDATGQVSAAWTLGPNSGLQTLSISSAGLSPVIVSATASGGGSNQVVITQQPGAAQTAGVTLTPAIVAEVRNSAGTLLSSFTGNVTLAIGTNPGGATLAGTPVVAAVSGVATFNNVSLNKAGVGYTVVASSASATSATSNAFTVGASAPATLALQSGGGQSGQPNTALPSQILARVADAFGNPVSGAQVQFSVSSGGGSVTPTSATTNNLGTAGTVWTLGAAGTQTLAITSPVLPNQPLAVSATFGAGSPATTTVSPQRDTITAFTDTRTITAQGRDAAGNLVGGSWTWVSRTPAVATVNASGVVTAVADGSSYIVATEAGASKDSSLIVVQQRVATVNVNPVARSIYNGGQFTFTAQAVDGRGVPMVTQPTFTWASTVPSVATITATSGVATGVGLGATQIRATAGTIVGVSNLTVLTPITRIDVTFDSTNAVAPDVFTMPSLGDRRMYRAIARDTLLNVIPGITFAWSSTNASVALIDSTTTTKARAVAAANGVTAIQATAQGVTGAASLTVAQVLSSIDLSPTSAVVAVTGTTQLIARGKDANGRFISGGSLVFSSTAPGIATVNASTGVVTGVANGSTNITASSGQITSNVALVSVNSAGPAVISFGRDTLGIGRGTTASVPILLSKPNASAVVVNLAVADTFAFFTTASVTIPAGQTAVNALLTGRNAGTTRVYAVDGGSTAYAGDTAVLVVQANLRMTSGSYSLVANDQLLTQALLSDPSPAGGTYVTFGYGTAGRVLVSPDPAFIPAGQLAADVVIRGVAQGTTSLTPSASGVTGTPSSVSVGAANLNIGQTQIRLGQGQYDTNNEYVQVPNNLYSPLTVTLASTDSTIARATSPVTIAAGSSYQYFDVSAVGVGTAQIISTAQGWRPDTLVVISTTPRVVTSGGGNYNTTSPVTSITAYAADSLRTAHLRTNSLVVRFSSSDSTVMKVIDSVVTIPAGNAYTTARVIPGGVGGAAWIRATASGHAPDSSRYTVTGPALQLSYTSNRLGVGQEEANVLVQVPNATGSAIAVTLTSSDSNLVGVNQVVTIPANGYYQYFTLRGKAPGTASVIATAVGYSPDTGTTVVTSPRLLAQGGGTLSQFQNTSMQAYSADSAGSVHNRSTPLTVTLRSTDTTVIVVDTIATIASNTYYLPQGAQIKALAPGSAKVIVTAPGHVPDTVTYTVVGTKLSLSWTTFNIGARQHADPNSFYVSIQTARGVAVPVTLTQKWPTVVSLSTTTATVPANGSLAYFTLGGLITGRDTIIATAPGYLPDTGFVTVSSSKLRVSGTSATATTTSPPSTLTVYAADSLNGIHNVTDTVVVHAVSTDSTVLRVGQPYFYILKNSYYANPSISYVGVGTARIIYSDSAGVYRPDSTNVVTVTGPSLQIANGNARLGMRQRTGATDVYVYAPNNVGTPLTVNLVATDPRVADVPASVTIPANSYYAYFTITAKDTIGTIQIQATATGYNAAATTVQVTIPKFGFSVSGQLYTTSPANSVTVYAMDANGSVHEVAQDVVVSVTSSQPGVVALDSTAVTIPTGQYYTSAEKMRPGAVGTSVLTASDPRAVFYKYQPATASVNVVTPPVQLSFSTRALGIGQYTDEYTYIPDARATPLTVPLGHSAVPHSNTPSSHVIPAGQNYDYFRVTATSVGSDTITASPSGYVPGKGVVVVSLGHIDPLAGWPTAVRAGDSVQVTLYARDVNQGTHTVAAATTFTLVPNANIQFVSGGANSAVITSATIPADASYVQFWLKGVTAGTGSANITATSYAPYTNTLSVTP